jgi:hypothetical protein
MIAVSLALLITTLLGLPIVRWSDPGAPLSRMIGAAFLIGTGIVTLILLSLSLAGVAWSLTIFFVIAIVVELAIFFVTRGTLNTRPTFRVAFLLFIPTIIILIAYTRFATAAAPWELDFVDNWGLKGRVFALHGGIDFSFLGTGWYWWTHPDYPPLLPLMFDFVSLFAGGWEDRWLGIFNVAFAVAAMLIVSSLIIEELESVAAGALAAFALVFLIATPWIGIADGPLVAFLLPGALMIRRRNITHGSLLLGCGALCKNEGLAFIAAVAVGMLFDRELRPKILRLWPALAITAPWLIVRATEKLATDLAQGSVLTRISEHFQHIETFALLLKYVGGRPMMWIGIALTIVVAARQWMRERFLLVAVLVQTCFYLVAYVVTPLDLAFHIRWSWDRLVWHVTPLVAFVAIVTSLPLVLRGIDRSAEPARD